MLVRKCPQSASDQRRSALRPKYPIWLPLWSWLSYSLVVPSRSSTKWVWECEHRLRKRFKTVPGHKSVRNYSRCTWIWDWVKTIPSWKSILCGCFGAVSTRPCVQFPATSIFLIRAVHINTISWTGCPGHRRMLPTWVFSSCCPPEPWSVMPSWVPLALKWTSLFQHCPSRLISSRRAQRICHLVWSFSPLPFANAFYVQWGALGCQVLSFQNLCWLSSPPSWHSSWPGLTGSEGHLGPSLFPISYSSCFPGNLQLPGILNYKKNSSQS